MNNHRSSTTNAISEVAEILAKGLIRYVTKKSSAKPSTEMKGNMR